MLLLRIARGVLRGLLPLWLGWAAFLLITVGLVAPAGWRLCLLVAGLGTAPLLSLVVHEYGHAQVAVALGARHVSLSRSGLSIAVAHEPLDPRSNVLIALGGPAASLIVGLPAASLGWGGGNILLVALGLAIGAGGLSLGPWSHDGRQILRIIHAPV